MLKPKQYQKVALIVLDGFGVASPSRGNAIALAGTPNLDRLVANYPSTTLQASGPLVGLPWGEMGNSEVGHLNMGAGRIVAQDLPRINTAIQDGSFFENPALTGACDHVRANNSSLHLMGLASSGGVHGYIDHLFALLALAQQRGIERVFIHLFLDGRDTSERVALQDVARLEQKIAEIGVGRIATMTGRFYAMDRGGHWDQTERTYRALVEGLGVEAAGAEVCVQAHYASGVYDEMVPPSVIVNDANQAVGKIQDGDAVVFFNFRQDRALQLTQAFVETARTPLASRIRVLQNLYFATMTEYRQGLPVRVAFAPPTLAGNLAEYLSAQGYRQFHAAESEKYAHVTAFFNCGVTDPLPGEDRQIVKSPSNSNNYSDQPQMAAPELTRVVVEKLVDPTLNFLLTNFANADMVGHTGNMVASMAAVRAIDDAVGTIADTALAEGWALIVTADHGNIEQLVNVRTGEIDKDHTTNPIPLLLIAKEFERERPDRPTYQSLAAVVPEGVVSDVAPTVLELFGLPKPPEMTAVSLLRALS
ncbi:MAG: 2,3-bisphosphoglycerate-independent phosphoglycerate mutase [Candidatus Doudnabacteria bacterium]|nr:2,3-bisphosphoglycerate-independent phosphoglycerate mutase [Candidatus Doudnabacteria bacterium]